MFKQNQTSDNYDGIQVSILASGSTGNSFYIETPRVRLLVDAGLSGKKIEELMNSINRSLSDLDAILVTHEHVDHIQGVGVLSRRYNIPIYANRLTWSQLDGKLGDVSPDNRKLFEADQLLTFEDLDIVSYRVSHDAIDAQFYAFEKGHSQFVMLTDSGYINNRLRDQFNNASAYLIESNHEVEVLRYGKYPWSLKQRILSDKGHLSNEDCGLALIDLIGYDTQQIFLGHLSKDNNSPELAMSTVSNILQDYDFAVNSDFKLNLTYPDQATPLQGI